MKRKQKNKRKRALFLGYNKDRAEKRATRKNEILCRDAFLLPNEIPKRYNELLKKCYKSDIIYCNIFLHGKEETNGLE